MTQLLLGIDAGLTTTTAALFTLDGDEVAIGTRETPVTEPTAGYREIDLPDLWATTVAAIEEALTTAPDECDVTAVGVAGHGHGLYLLDGDGEQVRPAIKSTDNRATELVNEWAADGTVERFRRRLGYEPFAADPLSLLAWLDRHEPDTLERTAHVCFCKDYIKYRLTGRLCTDEMEASVFLGPNDEVYDDGLLDALDIPLSTDVLPEVVSSWEPCGAVTTDSVASAGLAAGTPVASGLHDVGATALGTGAYEAGQGVLIVGTWGQSIVVLDDPLAGTHDDDVPPGLTRRYLDGTALRYKGLRSAAVCLDWFTAEVGEEWRQQAEREQVSEYAVYDRVAAGIEPGARGLLFHPYLNGSTDDPDDKGGFYGLTTDHGTEHMLRSVYEGVALSLSARLRELGPDGAIDDVRLGGGGARSELWSDVFASAVENTILVPGGEEAGARGAAICGAIAADHYPDHETAVDAMVDIQRRHKPDADAAAVYRDRRETFDAALEAIRPTWKRLHYGRETGETNE